MIMKLTWNIKGFNQPKGGDKIMAKKRKKAKKKKVAKKKAKKKKAKKKRKR